VGIDYSLFVITRYRELLKKGLGVEESIARSIASSGGAVVFAGCTVIVALLSLYFSGIPIVGALGYASAIVVAVAMAAAITLLPAILGLLGERINSLRVPIFNRPKDEEHAGGWERWARWVGKRPAPIALIGLLLMLLLALPLLDIRLGQPDDGQLPTDTETRQSYDALAKGFGGTSSTSSRRSSNRRCRTARRRPRRRSSNSRTPSSRSWSPRTPAIRA
jgi:RND superfamily putative drug exporter